MCSGPSMKCTSPIIAGGNRNKLSAGDDRKSDGGINGTTLKANTKQEIKERRNGYYYLTPKAAATLPGYQYSGIDQSLIYKYVLSPLAQFLVDHATPKSVAPNTITLFGLCWMISSYCFIWFYCPNLSEGIDTPEAVPSWIFLFNCVAMLVYQTLDNMDGKQARRTGSSSPLGLLFDHGCDAFNVILGSANWMAAMGINPLNDQFQVWILVVAPMAAFYMSTWEEYYTGTLLLPPFNGPNEGLIMGAMLSLTSYAWGVSYWHETGWYEMVEALVGPCLPESVARMIPPAGIRNCDMVAIASLLALFQEVTIKVFTVSRKYGLKTIVNACPLLFFSGVILVIGFLDRDIFARNPRTCLHIASALFTDMVTQLMLDHATDEKYNPFRILLVPLGALGVLVTWGTDVVSPQMIDNSLIGYASALTVFLSFKMSIVVHEICHLLKIWCFDIVTPYSEGGAVLESGAETKATMESSHKMNGVVGSSILLKKAS